VAVTHVEQVFENDTPFLLEGIYFFPLPDSVPITEFAMWEGGKRLVGEARSRDDARRIYNEIVRSRRDPALLEYAGKNLFQASIFPIQPNSEKKIELTYSQVLDNEGGTVAYRYPLGVGWQANGFRIPSPRPRPMPMPVPRREMERGLPQPGKPDPLVAQISGVVEISARAAIKGVYSPSHDIDVRRDGERKARLSFESRSASQQDFHLFYSLSDKDFGLALMTNREPGKDGYFLLLVSPKAQLDEREVSAKEVVFVLDTSGSMSEEGKMDKAKSALGQGVETLGPRDRFNIISFAGEERLMSERLIAADADGRRQAREFIERMRPTGGTNINDALMAAFKQLQPGDVPQMVVLITDGQPTVGEVKTEGISANAKGANKSNARLFTFGVGYDVNTILLDGLANANRGAAGYIEPNEDIEVKVSNFFAKVNHPVLSDVKIDWGGAETDLVYPRVMPDIFHGSQLMLIGRYRPSERSMRLTLTGTANGSERRFVYDDQKFPEKQTGNEFLPHLWAMRRVGHLLEQIRLNGESKELRDEIVDLGTRYGIVTPYTSYLVLEPEMRLRPVQTGSINLRADAQVDMRAFGRDAVAASKRTEELREADKVTLGKSAIPANQIRQVGGKTFYLKDSVWTDSEYKADSKLSEVRLKFAGDEYFDLAGKDPKLAEFFALGERVIVVWKNKVYLVVE
jgi:Ca-activated chloride channel family protein